MFTTSMESDMPPKSRGTKKKVEVRKLLGEGELHHEVRTDFYNGTNYPSWARACISTEGVKASNTTVDRRRDPGRKDVIERLKSIEATVMPVSTKGRHTADVDGRDLSHTGFDKGHAFALSLGGPDISGVMFPQPRESNQKIGQPVAKTPEEMNWRETEVFLQYAAQKIMAIADNDSFLSCCLSSYRGENIAHNVFKERVLIKSGVGIQNAVGDKVINAPMPLDFVKKFNKRPRFHLRYALQPVWENSRANTPVGANLELFIVDRDGNKKSCFKKKFDFPNLASGEDNRLHKAENAHDDREEKNKIAEKKVGELRPRDPKNSPTYNEKSNGG